MVVTNYRKREREAQEREREAQERETMPSPPKIPNSSGIRTNRKKNKKNKERPTEEEKGVRTSY